MTYHTIVADPPWPFRWSGGKGGRRRRETALGYRTMTVADICALPGACNPGLLLDSARTPALIVSSSWVTNLFVDIAATGLMMVLIALALEPLWWDRRP